MKIQERRAYFGFGVRDRAEAHRWLEEQGQRDWVLTRNSDWLLSNSLLRPAGGPATPLLCGCGPLVPP